MSEVVAKPCCKCGQNIWITKELAEKLYAQKFTCPECANKATFQSLTPEAGEPHRINWREFT